VATPIGHALAGYMVYSVNTEKRADKWALLWVCLLLAVAPDLDFLPGLLLGQPDLYHQGISHSLGLAAVIAFAAALVYRRSQGILGANWVRFFAAYTSHLVIDMLGPDRRPPYGIPLFWPVSDEYYLAPFSLFPGVRHGGGTSTTALKWITALFNPYNFEAIAIEVAVMLVIIGLVQYLQGLWSMRRLVASEVMRGSSERTLVSWMSGKHSGKGGSCTH